jgi:hypothetical protein
VFDRSVGSGVAGRGSEAWPPWRFALDPAIPALRHCADSQEWSYVLTQLPFLVDQRALLKGRAAIHAVLIGVSQYERVNSLGAGAHTAVRLFEWLKAADAAEALPAPLGTATLLLSPSHAEVPMVQAQLGSAGWASATGANVLAARERLRDIMLETENALKGSGPEVGAGIVIYYFGGHGLDFFRNDPIGLACDFDERTEPWVGAFDHQEYRERLTRIDEPTAVDPDRRVRCLFLYDCCRTRKHNADFRVIKLEHEPVLTRPAGIRPFQTLSAATENFAAWEPARAIPLSPGYPLPLSFFGHALLNVMMWSQDHSPHPGLRWCTLAGGLVDGLWRTMNELAKHEGGGTGEKLAGAPATYRAPPDFPIARSAAPPPVIVNVSCEPETSCATKSIDIYERLGTESRKRRTLPPWTTHPESCTFVPGTFTITAMGPADRNVEKTVILKPVLTAWEWIVRDDEIAIHDPTA